MIPLPPSPCPTLKHLVLNIKSWDPIFLMFEITLPKVQISRAGATWRTKGVLVKNVSRSFLQPAFETERASGQDCSAEAQWLFPHVTPAELTAAEASISHSTSGAPPRPSRLAPATGRAALTGAASGAASRLPVSRPRPRCPAPGARPRRGRARPAGPRTPPPPSLPSSPALPSAPFPVGSPPASPPARTAARPAQEPAGSVPRSSLPGGSRQAVARAPVDVAGSRRPLPRSPPAPPRPSASSPPSPPQPLLSPPPPQPGPRRDAGEAALRAAARRGVAHQLQPLPQARFAGFHLRGQAGGRRPGTETPGRRRRSAGEQLGRARGLGWKPGRTGRVGRWTGPGGGCGAPLEAGVLGLAGRGPQRGSLRAEGAVPLGGPHTCVRRPESPPSGPRALREAGWGVGNW